MAGSHEQAHEHARVLGSVPLSTFNSCVVPINPCPMSMFTSSSLFLLLLSALSWPGASDPAPYSCHPYPLYRLPILPTHARARTHTHTHTAKPSTGSLIEDGKEKNIGGSSKPATKPLLLLLSPPGLIRGKTRTHPPPHMTCMYPPPHSSIRAEGCEKQGVGRNDWPGCVRFYTARLRGGSRRPWVPNRRREHSAHCAV